MLELEQALATGTASRGSLGGGLGMPAWWQRERAGSEGHDEGRGKRGFPRLRETESVALLGRGTPAMQRQR